MKETVKKKTKKKAMRGGEKQRLKRKIDEGNIPPFTQSANVY